MKTESQVIAESNKAEQPNEIKEDYIESKQKEVGINAYKSENVAAEIMSPYRKRKGTLSLANIRKDSGEND